jgi:hypothetical protein
MTIAEAHSLQNAHTDIAHTTPIARLEIPRRMVWPPFVIGSKGGNWNEPDQTAHV